MNESKKVSANKQRKIDTVANLKDKLVKAKALFLTDYRGLTHQQLEQLRKSLKKVEAEFLVAKNTLLKLAMQQLNNETVKQLEDVLNNPTATLLAYGDEISPIKELAAFIKSTSLPKIKLGFFGGKIATVDDFKTLSSLPTRNVLLATLVSRLQSPISSLHYTLNWNIQKFVMVLSNIKKN